MIQRRPVATCSRLYRCRRIRAPVPRSRSFPFSGIGPAGRGVSTNVRLTVRALEVRVRRKLPLERGLKSRSSSSRPLSFGYVFAVHAGGHDGRPPGRRIFTDPSLRRLPRTRGNGLIESIRVHRNTLVCVEFVSVVRTGERLASSTRRCTTN